MSEFAPINNGEESANQDANSKSEAEEVLGSMPDFDEESLAPKGDNAHAGEYVTPLPATDSGKAEEGEFRGAINDQAELDKVYKDLGLDNDNNE